MSLFSVIFVFVLFAFALSHFGRERVHVFVSLFVFASLFFYGLLSSFCLPTVFTFASLFDLVHLFSVTIDRLVGQTVGFFTRVSVFVLLFHSIQLRDTSVCIELNCSLKTICCAISFFLPFLKRARSLSLYLLFACFLACSYSAHLVSNIILFFWFNISFRFVSLPFSFERLLCCFCVLV